MGEAYIVLTSPSQEPVTASDVKPYMRVDFNDEDATILELIKRARSYAETITGRALAYQQIQEVFTIERPAGGELSGPIGHPPNWYQYQEQLGANPFGASQFYFDLAMPPVDRVLVPTVETKVTAFDSWVAFTGTTYLDYVQEPARLYFQSPVTANFWRFTFYCGYGNANTTPLPYDLKQTLSELVAYWYDHREGEDVPQAIMNKLLSKRIASAWI